VRVTPDALVTGPEGEALTQDAIGAGARVWLGGRWTEGAGFVADEVRLRPRRDFEIVKVAGPRAATTPIAGAWRSRGSRC
jgi:hypothetical protein